MNSSAQNDFSFLVETAWQIDEDLSQESSCTLSVGGSTDSRKRQLDYHGPTFESFAPTSQFCEANMHPAVVDVTTSPNGTVMRTVSSVSVDFEPIRIVMQAAPPKRFYRTFWRSITRRLMTQAGQKSNWKCRMNESDSHTGKPNCK